MLTHIPPFVIQEMLEEQAAKERAYLTKEIERIVPQFYSSEQLLTRDELNEWIKLVYLDCMDEYGTIHSDTSFTKGKKNAFIEYMQELWISKNPAVLWRKLLRRLFNGGESGTRTGDKGQRRHWSDDPWGTRP